MNNLNENSDPPSDTQSYNSFIFSLDCDIGNNLKKELQLLGQSSKGNNSRIGNFSENSEQNDFIFNNDPQQNKKVDEYSKHELSEKKKYPKIYNQKKKK